MLADRPAKALPLLPAAEENAYRISEKPCAPGLAVPARPAASDTAIAVPTSAQNGGIRITSEAIFISKASIFLPRYSGVRPDHAARR